MEWDIKAAKDDAVLAALSYLKREESIQTLETIRETESSGNYIVAFIGQFSSGKSSLINSLLDRDLLPQGIKETTPLLTYIRYGASEKAVFHYEDGHAEEKSLDEVKKIIQSGESATWSGLKDIDLLVDAEALRNGMVLLDTPGVNTLIERHELLMARSMALASRVIYVTKGAPDQVDISKMKDLSEQGFDLSYVRTHFDTVKKSEETDEHAIAADRLVLSDAGVALKEALWVSNDKSAEAYRGIVELRGKLAEIGENAQRELKSAAARHVSYLGGACVKELDQRREALEDVKAGKDKEIMDRLTACQENIQSFEKMVERKQQKLNEEMTAGVRELRGPVRDRLGQNLERVVKRIADADADTTERMSIFIHNEAAKLGASANEAIDSVVMPMLHGMLDDSEMKRYSVDLDELPTVDSYLELTQTQDEELSELRAALDRARENEAELELRLQEMANSPAYQELLRELTALEQEILDGRAEYENFPAYVPQMIEVEDGRPQPSQVAKVIGNVADLAFYFLPGSTISGGLKALSESEKVTKWLGKLAPKLKKVMSAAGKAEKVEKTINTADAVKDRIFALGMIKDRIHNAATAAAATRATQKRTAQAAENLQKASVVARSVEEKVEKKGGFGEVLNYLTIEHWAEQIGKPFDRKPVMKEDPEYKAAYDEEKKRVYGELRKKQEDQFKKQCEYGVYETEKAKLEAQVKASQIDEQRAQEELARREARIRAEAETASLQKWRNACATQFREMAAAQLDRIIGDCCESLPNRLRRYQDETMRSVRERLAREQTEYQRLSQMPESDAEQELSYVKELLSELRDIA